MVLIFTGCDIYGGKLIVSLLYLLSADFAFSVVKKIKKISKKGENAKIMMYHTKNKGKTTFIPAKS